MSLSVTSGCFRGVVAKCQPFWRERFRANRQQNILAGAATSTFTTDEVRTIRYDIVRLHPIRRTNLSLATGQIYVQRSSYVSLPEKTTYKGVHTFLYGTKLRTKQFIYFLDRTFLRMLQRNSYKRIYLQKQATTKRRRTPTMTMGTGDR